MDILFIVNILFLSLVFRSIASLSKNSTSSFWQITDIHWDLLYSKKGDASNMCHELSTTKEKNDLGTYGDYLCDSPYALFSSALLVMKTYEPNPNFILWTGDNAPHTKDLNFGIIFKTISNLTNEILSAFGEEVPLIPVLGNHDSFPKDNYPASSEDFYERYLLDGGWKEVLIGEAQKTFLRGGYYTVDITPEVNIIVLNTNLYYRYNEIGEGLDDPGGQFDWMSKTLEQAVQSNKKVFVAAHAPPGFWERNAEVPFFNDSYNERYIEILNKYGDVILAHIYGHEHTDSFRIFGSSAGPAKSVAFLAPSLTPWFPTRLKGGTAINPSLRIYSYTPSSVLSYKQLHMNLTEANNEAFLCHSLNSSESEACFIKKELWKIYYETQQIYGVESLNVETLSDVYGNLLLNDTFFQAYFLRNSAGISHGYCNNTCKRSHICAIRFQRIEDLSKCLDLLSDYNFSNYFDLLFKHGRTLLPTVLPKTSQSLNFSLVVWSSTLMILILVLGTIFFCTGSRRKLFFPPEETVEFSWIIQSNQGYKPLRTQDC